MPGPFIPAATLILFDDSAPARHLLLARAAHLRFAPNALVFPGGRVEADDFCAGGDEDDAAKVAAIRETLEETGLAVGIRPAPSAGLVAEWRAALKAEQKFSALLAAAGCRLDLAALTPYSRWLAPDFIPRRFDTRFYAARAEGGEARADSTESASAHWLTAQEALASGHPLMFPTARTLERLAAHPSLAATCAHLATVELLPIAPELLEIDGEKHLRIAAASGHPVTLAPLPAIG
jgi:8-oxo-dGTP pyrophosphatase MutT (NUDIX family)